MSNIVAIENLMPGMVIVQITKQNGPVKIRKSGLVTSDAMVQGLSEMGVQEVEIDPEQTVEIAPAVHHRTQTQALLRGEHDTTLIEACSYPQWKGFRQHGSCTPNKLPFLPSLFLAAYALAFPPPRQSAGGQC